MTSAAMSESAVSACRRAIARGSKSFSLASRLLPARVRDDAVVVYAFCRRADDAVDESAAGDGERALAALWRDVDAVWDGPTPTDPVLAAFRDVATRRRIPRRYPRALIEGFAMDVRGARYDTLSDVLAYAYRVAGSVGLMMCHVMGVFDEEALVPAAHMGIAMQLTNICRDVAEDWARGRLYLPADRLAARGAPDVRAALGAPLPAGARAPIADVIRELLVEAERYYRSGDRGLGALSPRCRVAVDAARRIYAQIGAEIARRGCDPLAGRAVVGARAKLGLATRATVAGSLGGGAPVRIPEGEIGEREALVDPDATSPISSRPRPPAVRRAGPTPHRKRRVPQDFDGVAARYDVLQRFNPGYRKHLRWSAERMELPPRARVLDLCCGTGISTEALVETYPRAEITALDASSAMLSRARTKRRLRSVRFVCGDAADPAAAGAAGPFDGILVAYGVRNLPDPDGCLKNLAALLPPGGVLAVHEYAVSDRLISRLVWNAVAGGIIVPLGSSLGRAPELFRYLRESVLAFDGAPALAARIAGAGLSGVNTLPMDGWQRGIVHTFIGRKPR